MSTVDQVTSRTFRDFLQGSDRAPIRTRLAADVDNSATTLTLASGLAQADELQALTPGVTVELGLEQCTIVTGGTTSITVLRGVNGTTPAAHLAGTLVTVAPTHARLTVHDAVCDQVEELFPAVWRLTTEELELTSAVPFAEVSATYDHVREAYLMGSTIPTPLGARVRHGLGSTGRVLVTDESVTGTVRATFTAGFPRPVAATDELADIGVQSVWERILVVGAAAAVLAGTPEGDAVDANFLTDELRAQSYPPGTAIQVAQRLGAFRDQLLDRAATRWRRQNRQSQIWTSPANPYAL